MSNCSCIVGIQRYGFTDELPCQTKITCTACNDTINVGDPYIQGAHFQVCQDCESAGSILIDKDSSVDPERFWDMVKESACNNMKLCCLDGMTPGAREMTIDVFDEALEETQDD